MKALRIALLFATLLTIGSTAWPSWAQSAQAPRWDRDQLGVGITTPTYFYPQFVFTDVFKSSQNWTMSAGTLTLTADGWPIVTGSDRASSWIYKDNDHFLQGVYTVTWDGPDASVQMTGDAVVLDAGPNFLKINYKPSISGIDGLRLRVTDSPADNPVRNIHVYAPGFGPGQSGEAETFNPQFKERLEPFGVQRYMELMRTQQTSAVNWADRPGLDEPRYTDGNGTPVELLVQLANESHASPWFNMPHTADEDYVRHFAEYVKSNLDLSDTSRKVYVEYSNEAWNPNYKVRQFLDQKASDNGTQWWQEWANEARADFDIWSDVFAGMEDQLVRVAAGQTSNRFHTPLFLDALDGHFDAIGVTAYLKGKAGTYDANTTSNQILDDMLEDLARLTDRTLKSNGEAQGNLIYWSDVAGNYSDLLGRDIQLIAYEGGQQLVPGNKEVPWYDAYLAAERDPRMQEVYETLLEKFFDDAGGNLFVHFGSVRPIDASGAWGLLEYQNQPLEDAPKYRAFLATRDAAPDGGNPGHAVPTPLALFAAVPMLTVLLLRRR